MRRAVLALVVLLGPCSPAPASRNPRHPPVDWTDPPESQTCAGKERGVWGPCDALEDAGRRAEVTRPYCLDEPAIDWRYDPFWRPSWGFCEGTA